MTLQQLCAPPLPFVQELDQFLDALGSVVPAQHLRRARERACTGIEERNIDLAARERLVDDGDIANNQSEKAKAHARLCYGEEASHSGQRDNISQPQGDK